MIKKIFGSLVLFGLCFIGFVNASGNFYVRSIGTYGYNPFYQNQDISVIKNGTVLTQLLGYTKRIIWVHPMSSSIPSAFFWDLDGYPAGYMTVSNNAFQGRIASYSVCDPLDGSEITQLTNCTNYSITEESLYIFGNFFRQITNDDYYVIYGNCSGNGCNSRGAGVGFSSSAVGSTLMFYWGNNQSYYQDGGLSNYYGLSTGLDFNTFPTGLLGTPPSSDNSGQTPGGSTNLNGGITLGSNESAINYFEKNYGRNESICYAGIDNVTTNWGSSVSFQEGTGLNIFQVFSGINNMSPDLNKVYVRLNSRLINYEQWFGRSGDPLYLSNYNTGTNQVDLYYDNLTFPFANNPVAVYFLASNISVHSEYSTMGSEIVSYCNLKINDGTFDEIIDQAVKNNITSYTEQSNKNHGLNPDGTVINNNINFNFTGDAFQFSGFTSDYSGTTNISEALSGFFSFFGDLFVYEGGSSSQTRGLTKTNLNPILPTYILWGFVLVILFKIFKKR